LAGFRLLLVGKGARVFFSGTLSVMTPFYLAALGYTPFYVGVALAMIVAGNVASNAALGWLERRAGTRKLLLGFSFGTLASGVILFSSSYFPLMLLGLFIGNASTTGTEAGPYQSVEAGTIPRLLSAERVSRAFGTYNLVGYSASAAGAFAASAPSYFGGSLLAFRLLYLGFGLVGLLLVALYSRLEGLEESSWQASGLGSLPHRARRDIFRLSVFFSMDALGGGFVSQSILAYWFYLAYDVSLLGGGVIFSVVNIITAASVFMASLVAEKLGNLRTMFFSHVASNLFLLLVPLAGTLQWSLAFLFLRQTTSQMDVPTRQAFLAELFRPEERVAAFTVTNSSRNVASLFGAPLSGAMFSAGMVGLPILSGGIVKLVYDFITFGTYGRRAK